jgi:hypothetical protein
MASVSYTNTNTQHNSRRYLEYNQIDINNVIFKKDDRTNKIISYYQYPDGIIKRLYIRTPFIELIGVNKNSVFEKEFVNFTINLKNSNLIELLEKIDEKMNEFRNENIFKDIEKTYNIINKDKMVSKIGIDVEKTHIINYKYGKKIEEINKLTKEKMIEINGYTTNEKYIKEARFIINPLMFLKCNKCIAYNIEIKYKIYNIKSLWDIHEKIIEYNINDIDF